MRRRANSSKSRPFALQRKVKKGESHLEEGNHVLSVFPGLSQQKERIKTAVTIRNYTTIHDHE